MLKHLLIENYALIEKLDIDFEDGLTVITGETGAGKSILLGALSLILGQRADTQVLMDKSRKCIIEGLFQIENIPIRDLFEKHQLDYDPQTLFRREINAQGKSRAFVNDTPVTLQVMKELAEKLIDIHSQHQNLLIGESSFQFDVVDSYSGHYEDVVRFRKEYRELQQKTQTLQNLEEKEKQTRTDLDYYRFQLDELDKAGLDQEEFERMEGEMQIIQNAEEISLNLEKAAFLLNDAEVNTIGSMHEVLQLLRQLERYNEKYRNLADRLDSVLIETRDITAEISRMSEEVDHDPQQAMEIQQKLDLVNKLFLKHNVSSVGELEKIRDDYRARIQGMDFMEEQISGLKAEIQEIRDRLMAFAGTLSEKRLKAIPFIEKEITGMLRQLGMPGAVFKIDCRPIRELSPNGLDVIDFLFTANTGGELREISRVASGGELSRLMLSVKSMISRKNLLPTIIFDEIDTGVSGETGTRVANILETIAHNMQVITITHLPQIASRGKVHLLVYKTIDNGKTKTRIKKIESQERILEVAKMLGGEKPSGSMMETAKELIFNKRKN